MKALLLPILLLATMPAQAEDADRSGMSIFGRDKPVPGSFMSTGAFIDSCSDNTRSAACSDYLVGLVDGFEAIVSLSKASPWICLPPGMSGSGLLEEFMLASRDIGDNEGLRSLPLSRTFHVFLRARHSCRKSGAK